MDAKKATVKQRKAPNLTMMGPQLLSRAEVGTVIDPHAFKGPYGDPWPLAVPMPSYAVESKCSHSANAGQWLCLTHTQRFENQFQKDTHIHTGTHVLAWFCFDCNEVQVP